MISVETPALQLLCQPEQGQWTLATLGGTNPRRVKARLGITYHREGELYEDLANSWLPGEVSETGQAASPHGPLRQIRIAMQPNPAGMQYEITFALTERLPLFLWQLKMSNLSAKPVWVVHLEMLHTSAGGLSLHPQPGDLGFFSHGWQSWSYSGLYSPDQTQRRTRLGPIQSPPAVNPSTPVPRRPGHYSSDFYGILVDRTHRTALLAGFLSQQQQFGTAEVWMDGRPRLRLMASGDGARLDPGSSLTTDWATLAFLDLNDPDPLALYLDAVARQHGMDPTLLPDSPSGWCSWYYYFNHLKAEDVERNLAEAARRRPELPLSIIQIDDGFERFPGDWFAFRPGFPQGVEPLAKQIRASGFTPGLWLAPFIVHPRAALVHEHPDYLLRSERGRPVNAGFIWDVFTNALDLTHPGALEYACRSVDTAAHEWGFPYLKLDFLYAGALRGAHHDPRLTRAQVLRRGLEALRQAAGAETTLLGCGVPLGSAIGLFEAMRISADVSESWLPNYRKVQVVLSAEPHMPSTRNALQNILLRAPLHRRWWVNDPDCLLSREDSGLTLEEVHTLATAISMTGGSVFLSDDVPALSPERLRIAQCVLPPIDRRPLLPGLKDTPRPACG
ncbi:MAG: alpha-galactosidase [Chloroflexi bacterium]|nr:alpha-galactosidase [Chloroflexota bacterium]